MRTQQKTLASTRNIKLFIATLISVMLVAQITQNKNQCDNQIVVLHAKMITLGIT